MSLEQQQQKEQRTSTIIKAKTLLSSGDERGALSVLRKEARMRNVMACYDAGVMLIQGIGDEKNPRRGVELIEKGRKLEEGKVNNNWKSDGSATDVLGPQSMDLKRLFL